MLLHDSGMHANPGMTASCTREIKRDREEEQEE